MQGMKVSNGTVSAWIRKGLQEADTMAERRATEKVFLHG